MPYPTSQSNSDRELNVQQLDTSLLSDIHEWDIYAQSEISFRHIVEENPDPRSDAARYKLIADVNLEAARAAFSRACSSTTLFKIPSSIMCDRTFARDAGEAYYLDAMYKFLFEHGVNHPLRVEDLPILKWRLHSRYFCAFSRRHVYLSEHYERRRSGHWIPCDSPDLEFFSDLEQAAWFPKLEAWIRQIIQPSGLPIPLPFVIFFFHNELRNAQRFPAMADSERIRRLRFCLEHEYYILFLSVWWNELYHGGKAFVVSRNIINILHDKCGHLPEISGKPAQAIIERMRMFADMPSHYHNHLCFSDGSLEKSAFIFAVKKVGIYDHTMPGGRRLWCRRDHRNISVSRRYSSQTFRRLELLQERISGPDLDEVPGLLSLVREQDWARYNSMRVADLLHNLVALHKHTHADLDETRRHFQDEERANDRFKQDNDVLQSKLEDSRRYMEEKKFEFAGVQRQLEEARRRVCDKEREVSATHHELEAVRRDLQHALRHIGFLSRKGRTQSSGLPRNSRVDNPPASEGNITSPQYTSQWPQPNAPYNARTMVTGQPAQPVINEGNDRSPRVPRKSFFRASRANNRGRGLP